VEQTGDTPSEVLALDIGGSKLALAQVRRDGTLGESTRTPTSGITSGHDVVHWVRREVAAWGVEPRSLGISTGGPIDDVRGMVTRMPRMEMLWGFPLADELHVAVPSLTSIRVVNDACAACAGEVVFGAGSGLRNVLYLTISTGIGGGAYIGGMLLRGDRGNVAEFGHMAVAPGGPRCDCGASGCLEAVASASGLYRQLVEAGIIEGRDRGWADLGPWLKERLEGQDPGVLRHWRQAMGGLATGIVNLWNCYVPQAIIIGGGLSGMVQSSRPELDALIAERACLMPFPSEVLRFSGNRHTIPLLGVAAVAGGWIAQEGCF
jgi:glucokinase